MRAGSTTHSIARATAAACARLVLSLVDLEGTTAEVHAVERLHRTRRIGTGHFDEPEAARLARIAIGDEGNLLDRAVRREQIANCIFGSREGKIADV